MKRVLKMFFKTAIVLLLLPLIVVFGLFIYAQYINPDAEDTMKEMSEFLEKSKLPGNGFGGEEGMKVIDSGYRSEKYFWLDNERLVFQKSYSAYDSKDVQKTHIWNIRDNLIKPLSCDCSIINFYADRLHYARFSETKTLPNGKKKADRFQATVVELKDQWVLENQVNEEELLGASADRHELAWGIDGKPWFRIRSDLRNDHDVPRHRFLYLWEWGWILRMPWVGPEHWNQTRPEMGFFDIGGNLYFGQPGKKVSDLLSMPAREYPGLKVRYIHFLEKFWLANTVYGDLKRKRIMGFIGRDGIFQELAWEDGWLEYSGIPLPTRKGIFWSGKDFRTTGSNPYFNGAYIKDGKDQIRNVVVGSAISSRLSDDGCKVAFFNTPDEGDRTSASLKVFNVCQSSINAKEMQDANY